MEGELANIEKISTLSMNLISLLNSQLAKLEKKAIEDKKDRLRKENASLQLGVEELLAKLCKLQTKQGEVQYFDFGNTGSESTPTPVNCESTSAQDPKINQNEIKNVKRELSSEPEAKKPATEKKAKKEKPKKENNANKKATEEELPTDVRRLDFRIGKIISAEKHPDAESLYVEQIDCGESEPRTVVSGLVRFVPLDQMQNRMVVVLCNLKPAKMRGITSQAMVMCASTPDKVEILTPPSGCVPGDLVEFGGFPRQPDSILNPKKKIFEACAPDLKTDQDCTAVYKNVAMTVPGKGEVKSQTLAGVQVK